MNRPGLQCLALAYRYPFNFKLVGVSLYVNDDMTSTATISDEVGTLLL